MIAGVHSFLSNLQALCRAAVPGTQGGEGTCPARKELTVQGYPAKPGMPTLPFAAQPGAGLVQALGPLCVRDLQGPARSLMQVKT